MGKSTISMAIFNSFLLVYQRARLIRDFDCGNVVFTMAQEASPGMSVKERCKVNSWAVGSQLELDS